MARVLPHGGVKAIMPFVASSALQVPRSRIRELADIAMKMDDVLKLYFGESDIPTPEYIQRAAQTALAKGEEELRGMLGRLKENRDFCLAALRQMPGVTVPSPDGAFYLFPKIEGLTDSFAFCRKLLEDTRIGLAPGVAFGTGGERSVRICYAAEGGILEQAMERLARFLSGVGHR